MPRIYDLIYRDFPSTGVERFSEEFLREIKQLTGQLFSELSECLQGGMADLEKVFKF